MSHADPSMERYDLLYRPYEKFDTESRRAHQALCALDQLSRLD